MIDRPTVEGFQSRSDLIVDLAVRARTSRSGRCCRGSAAAAVTTWSSVRRSRSPTPITTWFTEGAADGFNVMGPALPSGLEAFIEHVLPILRSRGLFREDYTGTTLREHYGLAKPANQFHARELATVSKPPKIWRVNHQDRRCPWWFTRHIAVG